MPQEIISVIIHDGETVNPNTTKVWIHNQNQIGDKAENYFKQVIKNNNPEKFSDEDIEQLAEDGHYEWPDGGSIAIVWHNTEN